MNVGIAGDRLVRRGEEIVQILGDPVCLGVGEVCQVVLRTEDGDGDKVSVLVLDGEESNKTGRLAGIVDVALLQRLAHLAGRHAQGVATNEGEERLAVGLRLG
jgi:hypothetical protein